MTANYNFVGNDQIKGKYLISKNLKLLISERKNITLNKPKQFIIDKSVPKGNYISSLYYVAENQYYFECNGVRDELNYSAANTAKSKNTL